MQFVLDPNRSQYTIGCYKPGQITVNDCHYTNSIIISADQLITNWPPQQLADISDDHLSTVFKLAPHVVICGTGKHHQFIANSLLQQFLCANIGIEVMNTAAACRTFNVLMSEGRNAVAMLLIN